jgi:hypothetical protein
MQRTFTGSFTSHLCQSWTVSGVAMSIVGQESSALLLSFSLTLLHSSHIQTEIIYMYMHSVEIADILVQSMH